MDKKVKIQKTGRFWQENFTKKWCRNTLQVLQPLTGSEFTEIEYEFGV